MKDHKKISLLGFLLGAVALLSSPAVHAQINTGIEYGSATGLSGGDIRLTIARIIQVFLGVLGIIALVLIIYAGFLWMTAGGDENKVTQAKRILAQASIGLVIILSSFALTTFIVSKLVEATGYNGGNNNGGGCIGSDCGGLGGVAFTVESITPPGSQNAGFLWPKNSQVRVVFRNGSPDPATTAGAISVTTGGVPVSGTIVASGNVLTFRATAQCVEDPGYTCLPGNATFNVTIAPTIKSMTGANLFCGKCSAVFSTSNLIDTKPPTVSIVSPVNGQSVSVASFVPVIADANDDSAVASVEFSANDVSLGSAGVSPWQIDWDTTGIPEGTDVVLKATATDAVGNVTLATPVTVTVRPAHCFNNVVDGGETGLNCGDGCGACPGDTCTVNSDCASGLCEGGRCVNRPRIDSVAPLSGGPGTLVTINGAAFGGSIGEVLFLGTNASGDEKVAAPCAPSAWSDTQLIVAVPEGAVSGPIQVTNSTSNRSDRTDDDYGNVSIPNFTVDTSVHPGICTMTPNTGSTGTTVQITGNGFGDTQGSGNVSMAGRLANVQTWNGTTITMITPNLLGGTWPVKVTAANNDSNNAAFYVPASGNSGPHLLGVEPGSGPVGEYITLTGSNLGNSPGKVEFVNGQDIVLAGVDFPPACGNDYWHDTSVTVKVPAGLPLGASQVRLERHDAVASDNSLPFTIVAGTPSAGICRIAPSSGPVGTSYEVNGERLGNAPGRVFFWNDVDGTSLRSSWNDSRMSGSVPTGAKAGGVHVVTADARVSNSLNFNVADCRKAQVCSGSEECCEDGTCRPPNSDGSSGCQAIKKYGSYRYRFSTGDIPLAPQVVEQVTCTLRSQSPSPYKGVTAACANSVASVRFTVPMDRATLTSANFKLFSCGSGDAFDSTACRDEVTGVVSAFGGGQQLDDGMELAPGTALAPNGWYQGVISKNVHSSAGVSMEADYIWNFRVRNSSDPCEISSITIAPAVNKLTDIYTQETRTSTENISYTQYKAAPANEVCNLLDCRPYAWNWQTDQAAAVGIQNPSICTPEVRALAETSGVTPALISATAMSKTGTGDITIKFASPQVIDKWPACQEACLNAQVAASFNVPIANVSTQTVKLFTCANETCAVPVEASGYTVEVLSNNEEHLAVIHPSGASLASNVFYRVVVFGGANGVRSIAGAELIGTNYVFGNSNTPAYSWVFRASDKQCSVDRVEVSPSRILTSIIGSYHSVSAKPFSVPDSCSANGQRLDGEGMNMSWGVNPATPGAADLYAGGVLNAKPLVSNYVTSACLNTGTVSKKPVCGNGRVENGAGVVKAAGTEARGGGEECDLGTNSSGVSQNGVTGSGCTAYCLLEGFSDTCGNGQINSRTLGNGQQAIEQCDDGNKVDGDGCSSKCLREGSSSGSSPSVCGNGDVADNEQCDDGNRLNGDGCSSVCTDEGAPLGVFSVCGNGGAPEPGEDCDLGAQNGKSGSGCSSRCLFTGTSSCTASGQANCCGNGTRDAGEGCDPGWNNVTKKPEVAAGCDSSCRRTGSTFSVEPPSVCGDGLIGTGEAADPGSGDTRVDGVQYAHAVGGGNALGADGKMVSMISATVDGKSGQMEFDLQCGYKTDADCQRFGSLALGSNSCCYPRPVVVTSVPRGANVCRNPLIEVEFDREMDAASFTSESFAVTSPVPVGGCPKLSAADHSPFARFWIAVRTLFTRVVAFVIGRPAFAAPGDCQAPGSFTLETRTLTGGAKHSFARFVLTQALLPGTQYTVTIGPSVKSTNGVSMGGTAYTWNFTTGADVCTLDAVNIVPESALFGSVYVNGINDPDSQATFVAQPVHNNVDGSQSVIASVPVYAWQIDWATSKPDLINGITNNVMGSAMPTNSATAQAGVKKAESGEAVLTATAKITADQLSTTSTVGALVSGVAEVTVMLCKNPWPARNTTQTWRPAQNIKYNYSFYYCRDAEGGGQNLPDLRETPTSPSTRPAGVLDQYLYTYTNALGSEGLGIRVVQNPLHLSPTEWYLAQGFKGNVSSTTVDGYEAVRDGRTVYVNAPAIDVNIGGANYANFTNIYVLSYTAGAGAETQDIFGQILKNFRFAANRANNGTGNLLYNDQNFCQASPATMCESDLDCPSGLCLVDRSKIRRDVKRLADIRLIAEAVQRKRDSSGAYPALPSGSYVQGQSISTWPSWNGEFAQEIGGAPPTDPLNKMAKCDAYATDGTCWSSANRAAICPIGSHVYRYMYPNNGIFYSVSQEALNISYANNCYSVGMTTQAVCETDPLCRWTGGRCDSRVSNICANQVISSNGAVCGNGNVENTEQCEKSITPTRTISCGSSGTQVDTCGNDCLWVTGSCQASRCGNGVKEPGEACDQGSLNGTYGHCNAACNGIGQSCGDGNVQQGEICDEGALNGQYNHCAFDCHGRAPYCGDLVTDGGHEECDGGSQTSPAALSGSADSSGQSAACGVVGGYQTSRTRTCDSCSWSAWGPCMASGSCGNGVKDGTEQCDNGLNNSDTGACTKSCRLASCGDANVRLGVEQCDQGAGNIDPKNATAIAERRDNCSLASCYYCSTSCTVKAITGAFCGDSIIQGSEQCDEGANNLDGLDAALVSSLQSRCNAGDTAACSFCDANTCQTIQTPRCGDNKIDKDEGCDLGTGNNGAVGSSCNASCQCVAEEFSSGSGGDELLNASGSVIGPAVVLSSSFTSRYVGNWAALGSARYLWSFDESNPAATPANWATADNTAYFRKTFTTKNKFSKVTLEMTADNSIDRVVVDGVDITSSFGSQMMNFTVIFSADITKYLKPGLTHTVELTVRNTPNGQGPATNPAMVIYRIIAYPDCGGSQIGYAPSCGNGMVDGGEQCDGSNLNNVSDCKTLGGYDIGSLSCNACRYNESDCRICSIAITGKVSDSQSGVGIPNMPIQALCGTTQVASGTTGANGLYTLSVPNNPALDSCSRRITVLSASAQSYCYDASLQQVSVDVSSMASSCQGSATANNIVMTQMPDPGKYTFVMSWTKAGIDLDAHMKLKNLDASHQAACWYSEAKDSSGRHIIAPCQYATQTPNAPRRCVINGTLDPNLTCNSNSDCPNSAPCACLSVDNGNAFLDIDTKAGPGTETITLTAHDSIRGVYYVDGTKAGTSSNAFAGSGAKVQIWGYGCSLLSYDVTRAINYNTSSETWWELVDFKQQTDGSLLFTPRAGSDGKMGTAPSYSSDPALSCP